MKKIIAIIGGTLLLCLLLVIVLNWSFIRQIATFNPIILPNFGSGPEDETEARLQDLDYLARLLDYDRSFDDLQRASFSELLSNGRQEVESMSPAQFYLLVAEAAALADNGHTNLWSPALREFNSVGLRYFNFDDGLYVIRARQENEPLLGARVLEIDGRSIESIFATLNKYYGGNDQWRELNSVELLQSADILHAAGLVDSPGGYTITIQDSDGSTQQIELTAEMLPIDGNTPISGTWEFLESGPLPDEGNSWVSSLGDVAADRLPLYLTNSEKPYYWQPLPGNGGYVRLQTMFNTQEQTLSAFFDEALKPLPDGSLQFLVVDLRPNDGGNFTLFVEIAKWLPDKLADDGNLYIVVGPLTFSGGLQGAALLKYYGAEKSSIIGSPMGDREQFWTDKGLDFKLPNSGYHVGYATGYHDWADGCEEHPYCYTQFLIHGVKAGSLQPDPIIESTYDDYAAGHDVVMDWVYEQEQP